MLMVHCCAVVIACVVDMIANADSLIANNVCSDMELAEKMQIEEALNNL